jgi:pyocin large subunit-like protein
MSVDALSWAKKQRAGSPAAKCVLMILADYADEHGVCWPSQETLARESEQSVVACSGSSKRWSASRSLSATAEAFETENAP